jgi:alkylhydroperoxidase family enzyme
MPRIPYRDEAEPEIATLVESIRARRKGSLLNLDRMLLHSPPYAQGWNALLGAVRRSLDLDAQVRELAICAVARLNEAPYEWHQHAPEYLAVGGAAAKLDGLDDVAAAARNTALYDERERAALALTLEMTRHVKVSEAAVGNARSLFGDRQLVELVGTVATYNMVSRFLEALGVDEKGE